MKYDLLIKGGTVVDGTGAPRFEADIGIEGGKIAALGALGSDAREVLDASDRVVSPGFVDAHTHMDAQIFWDPLGTCSCWHGVTSVVMGNCGFTLAPVRGAEVGLVLENLEEAEAIPAEVMAAGVEFEWETFPEFIEALERRPKGINYCGYVGHSALRTYAMGERAFTEEASPDDLAAMAAALRAGLRAGAVGFSTSRNPNHIRPRGEPVASRVASWSEVRALVGVMAEEGLGIFEISREDPRSPEQLADFNRRLAALAIESHRPVTLGVFSALGEPGAWRTYLDLVAETNRAGGRMIAQVHSNTMYEYHSLRTRTPFDAAPPWQALRRMPDAEKRAAIADPGLRRRLVEAARGLAAAPDYDRLEVVERFAGPNPSVAELARAARVDPAEVILDLARESDLGVLLRTPFANERPEEIREMLEHEHAVVTFSDSGAHVSEIADSCLQTVFLARWVRDEGVFSLEAGVRRITGDIASAWGLHDRGTLAVGKAADIAIFDPDALAPLMPEVAYDLPLSAKRLRQRAAGVDATIVNGEVLLRDGEHTGALPGRVLKH